MKKTALYALAAINFVLLGALLLPYVRPNAAMAQRAGTARRPDVMMIPGEVVGANSAVVYLIDSNNGQLGAITLNNRQNGVDAVAPVNLGRIFDEREAEGPEMKKEKGKK